jgi:hypothetical protein
MSPCKIFTQASHYCYWQMYNNRLNYAQLIRIMFMTALTHWWQLTFDFQITPTKEHSPEEKQSFHFYPADSTILKNIFSLKVSYNWRSYILKWKYRIATIKAFGNLEDKMSTIWFVELENILAFKWFMYSKAFLTKQENLKLKKVAEKIISNPEHNENLADY